MWISSFKDPMKQILTSYWKSWDSYRWN